GFRQRIRRADQDLDDLGLGGIATPGDVVAVIVVVPLLVQVVLFEVGQQFDPQVGAPGRTVAHVDGKTRPDWELPVVAVVVVRGQGDLLEVVQALGACGGRADLLDGGEQQADEDGDDRDHHQQLNQGEAAPSPG